VIIFSDKKDAKVVVIKSKLVSQAYYQQFEILWKTSKQPVIKPEFSLGKKNA